MNPKREQALVIYSQLKGLHIGVERIQPDEQNKPGLPGSGISAFIKPFNSLLERTKRLVSDDENLRQFIADINLVKEVSESERGSSHKVAKSSLLSGCALLLGVLETLVQSDVDVPAMKITREGVFFAGQYFDALQRVSDIIGQGTRSIFLVDGYVDKRTLDLLTQVKNGVEIRILTKPSSAIKSLETMAQAFSKQYAKLSIRTSEAFHDRFLIVDDSEFYHFGASIKDVGHRGFMFSRIEEPTVVEALRNQFQQQWSSAANFV